MELDDVLNCLALQACRSQIEPEWEQSVACLPARGCPFLEPACLAEACAYAGCSKDLGEALQHTARHVAGDGRLTALIWHCCRRMFHGGPRVSEWPKFGPTCHPELALFYVLALLGESPGTRAFHQAHGIPPEVAADTMSDLQLHVDKHLSRYGHLGLTPLYAGGWLKHHFKGEIYKLGRLQFMHSRFPAGQIVLRSGRGEVAALAQAGLPFRADGERNGCSGITETDGVWISTLTETPDKIVGHWIDPATDVACREVRAFSRREWEVAIRPGDPALDMHIPATGPMTAEGCVDSVHRAVEFFPRHFPELPRAKAVICNSWLLDAQLEEYLPADSNIVRFLREFYLLPVECDAWTVFRQIYDADIPYGHKGDADISSIPRKTTLERALHAHVEAGRRWKKAGGFVLVEDLPWGRQPYRR